MWVGVEEGGEGRRKNYVDDVEYQYNPAAHHRSQTSGGLGFAAAVSRATPYILSLDSLVLTSIGCLLHSSVFEN